MDGFCIVFTLSKWKYQNCWYAILNRVNNHKTKNNNAKFVLFVFNLHNEVLEKCLFFGLCWQKCNHKFQKWKSLFGTLLTTADLKTSESNVSFLSSVTKDASKILQWMFFVLNHLNKHFRNECFLLLKITTAKKIISELNLRFLYSVYNNAASNFNPECVILQLCSHVDEKFQNVSLFL